MDGIFTLYGNIIDPFEGVSEGFITITDGKISARATNDSSKGKDGDCTLNLEMARALQGRVIDLTGCYISPGFIDLHVHGGAGADFSDATEGVMERITRFHAGGGTTSLLATLIPLEKKMLLESLQRLARNLRGGKVKLYTNVPGIHLEGPFINANKKGALEEGFLSMPDISLFSELFQASEGFLKMMTLAPELEGAEGLVKEACSKGVLVSAGHTEADCEKLAEAVGWGLKNVTHFYNAMEGFHHRSPGTVGGGLLTEGLAVDIIPEINHVHSDAFRLAWQHKGPSLISVITDCTSPGGMPDGSYNLGGKGVTLHKGVARLDDGTLAGSTITMIEGIRYLSLKAGLRLQDAVGLASLNPARLLGVEQRKGRLAPGMDGDITVFDKDYRVVMTIVGGRVTYSTL